ncbi:MAG: hypothetical protein IPF94_13665 [Betaproteobacteria bacterium]|nr:hypothetical protein [Betaproteobacteria bacterium]
MSATMSPPGSSAEGQPGAVLVLAEPVDLTAVRDRLQQGVPGLQRIGHEAQVRGRRVDHGLRLGPVGVERHTPPDIADAGAQSVAAQRAIGAEAPQRRPGRAIETRGLGGQRRGELRDVEGHPRARQCSQSVLPQAMLNGC